MQIYLYQLRKEKGITQKELAQKLGISETAYRQKEKGQSAFTPVSYTHLTLPTNREV